MRTKHALRTALAATILSTSLAGALAERPTYSECVRHGMIDDNMWVFGALGYLVVSQSCSITTR